MTIPQSQWVQAQHLNLTEVTAKPLDVELNDK